MKRMSLFPGKALATAVLLTMAHQAQAVLTVQAQLYPVPGQDSLEVRLLPNEAFSGNVADFSITVRYADNVNVSLGNSALVTGLWPAGFEVPAKDPLIQQNGGYTYVTYARFTISDSLGAGYAWTAGVERPFFRIGYTNTSGSCVVFLSVDDAFTTNTPLEYYMSIYYDATLDNVANGTIEEVDAGYISADPYPVKNLSTGAYYCTIQSAINDAGTLAGHTIQVAAGNYAENVTINKGVTLSGANANATCATRGPESLIAPASGAPVMVTADGVTVNGFEITCPTYQFAVQASGRTDLSLLSNHIHHVYTSATGVNPYAISYTCNVNADNVHIADNCIDHVNNTSNNNRSGGGIAVGFSTNNGILTDLVIERNTISDITAPDQDFTLGGRGAYGIHLNVGAGVAATGQAVDAIIRRNVISDLSGFWAHGIGLEGETPGALVEQNSISDLSSTKDPVDAVGVMIESNPDISQVEIIDNSFTNTAIGIENKMPGAPLDATGNWFGSADPAVVATRIRGNLDVTPFNNDGIDTDALTLGFQPNPTSLSEGPVAGNDPVNSWLTIQDGIDGSNAGATLTVAAGSYAEALEIDKSLSLLGPNANINPCTGVRVAEAVILPDASQPFYDGATEVIMVLVEASDVTIKGFTIDGDNTALTSSLNAGGANIDAADGIDVYTDGVSDLLIENNIITNVNEGGFNAFPSGASATSGNAVVNNKLLNIPGASDPGYPLSGYGIGAIPYNNFYCTIDNNCMTDVRIGVQTGNFHLADPGNARSISNNTITGFGVLGIWHNLAYQSASNYTISGNSMSTTNNATSSGLFISSIQQTVGVTATGNSVSGAFAGVELWSNPTSSTVTIGGGTLTNCVNGVFANNYDGYTSDASSSSYVLNGISIAGGSRAVYVKDNSSNTNGATVAVTLLGGVTTNGSTTSLRLEGAGASASFSGPGAATFTGSTTYIEEVSNGTDKPAAAINATAVTFDGDLGSGATHTELFAIENKITHRIDDAGTGFVEVKDDNVHVTDITGATATNNDYTRLANAVSVIANNWSVNLGGTFDWTEASAAASWALGNDNTNATGDDYSLLLPPNVNGVTFTAPNGLGTATIEGPGDVPTINLEGVLYFDGTGDNQGWTISNLFIDDFDLPIGMFFGAGGPDAYSNTTITNNHILIATDLNATAAPGETLQNIGLHYAFGTDQTISNNIFDVPGNGVSAAPNNSSTVVMQSNTSGGNVYDGLQITGNTINVFNSPSVNPPVLLGIWENGAAHLSDITVSNNTLNNLDGANDPVANLQRAFRVTSHSSATTTVTYSGNTVNGANIGLQWIAGSNFSGQLPVVVTANTLVNNATAILVQSEGKATVTNNFFENPASSTGAVQALTLGATGTANTITATDNSLLNNGNPLGKLALNPGTGTISATCNWWGSASLGGVSPLISGAVSYIPIRTNGTDADLITAGFQPTGSCGGYPVINTTTNEGFMTIQAGHDDPDTQSGHTLALDAWTFSERVILTKALTLDGAGMSSTILDGTGIGGTGSGIDVASGLLDVTIRDLCVRNYPLGSSSYAGIAAQGGNNGFAVLNCEVHNNTSGRGGVYVNGPVDDVLIDNVKSHDHPSGSRGIVIWNGLKSNITITNCEVYNNNCCGIELQDGTASGVTMTGNNVHDNADNGMGLLGLGGNVGPNLIANNTLTNNGRFGIEVKMPGGNGTDTGAGSVVVEDNTVSFAASPTMNNRDHAGIAVFRRSMLAGNSGGNADIPTGVVVRDNDVSGYTHQNGLALNSQGFGIVIEGVDHSVTGNDLTNNDVGLQLQGGGHPVPNYSENNVGDGNAEISSPNYFGRGNAPYVCNVTTSSNTFSGNTTNEQVVTSAGVLSPAAGTNQKARRVDLAGTTYCTIQKAVDKSTGGQTASVYTATYDEQVLVNKSITIDGQSPLPTVDFTGTVSGKPTLFDVSVDDVSITDLRFNTDLAKLKSAIIVSGATIDAITITGNTIDAYGTPVSGLYTDRNAVSVNFGGNTNYRVATGGVDNVTFTGNTVNGALPQSFFRAGICADEVGGDFSGNTLQSINQDIQVRFGSNGDILVDNNTLNGGGVELAEHNAGAGTITVTNNDFDGTMGNAAVTPRTAVLRLKNNQADKATLVSGNSFTDHRFGLSLENYRNVTVDDNTFTPEAASTDYVHIGVNTKSISSNSNLIVQTTVDGSFTNNVFNGGSSSGGTALGFYNHDSDNASFGTFTVGGNGDENTFNANIATFVRLDNQTGSSNGATTPTTYPATGTWPTTMACWSNDLEITENFFDVGSGPQTPGDMSPANQLLLEGALFHDPDDACTGRLTTLHLRLAAAAFVEGPYDGGSGLMGDALRAAGYIPAAQPYNVAPFSYGGTETVAPAVLAVTGVDAIVDWILVELRDDASPTTVIARQAALLQRDGDIVSTDGSSPLSFELSNGAYHVAVRHRNHLGVMTGTAPVLTPVPGGPDFRSLATATFGTDAQKTVAGVNVLWTGNSRPDNRLRYTGPTNDRDPILVRIGGTVPNNTVDGYYVEDNTMNGQVKYTGALNDRDPILVNLPGPVNSTRLEQLP